MIYDIQTLVKMAALSGGGIAMGMGAIGAAMGEGYTASQANVAMSRDPKLSGEVLKSMLIGQAIAESSSIFALVIAVLILFMSISNPSIITAFALFSAGICMGFGAIGSGAGSGFPAGQACLGLVRQPSASEKVTRTMLIGSAVCQDPSIFAMVIALMLLFLDFSQGPLVPTCAALLGAGLCSGLVNIGAGLGCGFVAKAGCEGVARHPENIAPVTTIMLVGQAVTQTASIFGLLISFVLMFGSYTDSTTWSLPVSLVAAGIATGVGGIGPGIGNGLTGEGATRWVARDVENSGTLMRIMLVGQAVSQSTAIYALVISLCLIFVV